MTSGLFHNPNIKFEIFLQYLKDSYYGVLVFWLLVVAVVVLLLLLLLL